MDVKSRQNTPRYMVKELRKEMLRGRTRIRACGYEGKLESRKGKQIARMLGKKGRARRKKSLEEWEEERRTFYEEKGWRLEKVESMREEGMEIRGEELVKKKKRKQEKKR